MITNDEILVKLEWKKADTGWAAELLTVDENGYHRRDIKPGKSIELEITEQKGCIGYKNKQKKLTQCPDNQKNISGRQCPACRNRDYYTDYIEGTDGSMRKGSHSVYLAQCGGKVKVGVTKSSRIPLRWIEQGAVYAVEIEQYNTASKALEREEELSSYDIPERIRKHEKYPVVSKNKIHRVMKEYGFDGEVIEVFPLSKYDFPEEGLTYQRYGRVVDEVVTVYGQLVCTNHICFPIIPITVVTEPKQSGLSEFV